MGVFDAGMWLALLERLERRNGVARSVFQAFQQQIFSLVGRGSTAVFEALGVVAGFDDTPMTGQLASKVSAEFEPHCPLPVSVALTGTPAANIAERVPDSRSLSANIVYQGSALQARTSAG